MEQEVTSLLQHLLKSPSTHSAESEHGAEVQRFLGEIVAAEACRVGLAAERDSIGNVVIRIGPRDAKRRLILFGYAMTNPGGRMVEPFNGAVQDGKPFGLDGICVRGRGASEQKGALAAVLTAAKMVAERSQELDGELVVCVSAAGETGRHDAAEAFMASLGGVPADMAVVAVGTSGALCLGHKGRVDIIVKVLGKSTHSSTPWEGVDAVEGARQVLNRLGGMGFLQEHPKLGRPTLTAISLKSFPDMTHTVQDEVLLRLDRRLLPGDDPEAAVAEVRKAIGEVPPFRVEVVQGDCSYPSEVTADSIAARTLSEAFQAVTGREPTYAYSHGALDAGYFNYRGIPAVMFGPGDQRLWHSDDERVSVADVVTFARVYSSAAMQFLGRTSRLRPGWG